MVSEVRGHLTIRMMSITVLPVKYFSFGLRLEPETHRKETNVKLNLSHRDNPKMVLSWVILIKGFVAMSENFGSINEGF